MSEEWRQQLADLSETYYWSKQVSYGYFCGEPEDKIYNDK
jgi:hypothetical protein